MFLATNIGVERELGFRRCDCVDLLLLDWYGYMTIWGSVVVMGWCKWYNFCERIRIFVSMMPFKLDEDLYTHHPLGTVQRIL